MPLNDERAGTHRAADRPGIADERARIHGGRPARVAGVSNLQSIASHAAEAAPDRCPRGVSIRVRAGLRSRDRFRLRIIAPADRDQHRVGTILGMQLREDCCVHVRLDGLVADSEQPCWPTCWNCPRPGIAGLRSRVG